MTTVPMLLGLVFWTTAVFFACRRAFSTDEGRFCELFASVKRKAPLLLWFGTGGGFGLALIFFFLQQQAINQQVAVVGPHFLMALLCGIVGATSLAAQVYLDD